MLIFIVHRKHSVWMNHFAVNLQIAVAILGTPVNRTIGGKLIATIPLAAACHDDEWATYDNATCTKMQNAWLDPETQ